MTPELIDDYKAKKEKKCSGCKILKSEKKLAHTRIAELEAELKKKSESKTELKKKYKDFKSKTLSLEANVAMLEAKVKELQDEADYLKNHFAGVKASLTKVIAKWPSDKPNAESNVTLQPELPQTPSTSRSHKYAPSTSISRTSASSTRLSSASETLNRTVSIFV